MGAELSVSIAVSVCQSPRADGPGAGYCLPGNLFAFDQLEQFEVNDERSPEQVAAMIRAQGFDPVCKDCDVALG